MHNLLPALVFVPISFLTLFCFRAGQELFPVFVLNLECPHSEVDILMEADKTWLEFSDWAAAKSTGIAMLLAFLPHFPHAVPISVLRDLRREFYKNQGEEAWTTASPPPPPRRASPEPALPPSPSPMRLGVPDLGMPSHATEGSPLDSCAWMGRDKDLSKVSEEGRYTMVSFSNFTICAPPLWYTS